MLGLKFQNDHGTGCTVFPPELLASARGEREFLFYEKGYNGTELMQYL